VFQTLGIQSLIDSSKSYPADPIENSVGVFTRTLARGVVDRVLATTASRGQPASAGDRAAILRKLHSALVEKLEKHLPNNPEESVVIVPDGSLFLVPFAALLGPDGTFFVERHTISVVPSLGIFALLRSANSSHGPVDWLRPSLVIGNPLMPPFPSGVDLVNAGLRDVQIPQLTGAEIEATAIASLLKTKALLGKEATEEEVTRQMKAARLIHLATHGLLIPSSIMIDEMVSGSLSADYPPGAIVLARLSHRMCL
jgi:CHAT domain-containing protein